MENPIIFSQNKNKIISKLPPCNWSRWQSHIESVQLKTEQVLVNIGDKIKYVYFPTQCIIAERYDYEDGSTADFRQIGNEGMAGVFAFMGMPIGHTQYVAVVAGESFRIEKNFLLNEFNLSKEFRTLLLRYMQSLIAQSAHTASCNRRHTIEQQLARFLLHNQDRISGRQLTFTHEAIAQTIGVRREGVSNAAKKLQNAGLIEYTRGSIEILNRHALQSSACECYKIVKDEYEQLLSPLALN